MLDILRQRSVAFKGTRFQEDYFNVIIYNKWCTLYLSICLLGFFFLWGVLELVAWQML